MSTNQPNTGKRHAVGHPPARRHPRRGVVTLLAVWALLISILIGAWVLNYNFLVLVKRNMQQKSDAVALAAAPALLDEDMAVVAGAPLRFAPATQLASLAVSRRYGGSVRGLPTDQRSPGRSLPEM